MDNEAISRRAIKATNQQAALNCKSGWECLYCRTTLSLHLTFWWCRGGRNIVNCESSPFFLTEENDLFIWKKAFSIDWKMAVLLRDF